MLLYGRHVSILLTILICMQSTGETQRENAGLHSNPNHTSTRMPSSNATNQTNITELGLINKDYKILIITTLTVAAVGALFNSAVILAIIIDPLKLLRKGAWITILNLAIADLISCVSCICVWGTWPLFPAIYTSQLHVAITQFGWMIGVNASFLLLTFFTVQIYVITKFPLKSRFMFTDVKILLASLGVWLFAILLALSSFAPILSFSNKTSFKLYAARIGVLQVELFIQIILNLRVSAEIIKSGRSAGNDSCQNKKHRNIAKTVIMLTFILFLTAFPYFLLKQIEFLARLGHLGASKSKWGAISYYYAPIAILNFTANPILYSLRLPDYRKTLFAAVGKSKSGTPLKTNATVFSGSTQFSLQRPSSFQRSKSCSTSAPASTPLDADKQL